ncbi:MAG: DUF2283 domain-containing protein [bacterium]|nr:DUF2283 domain-containing protein [bacterium]
MKVTYDPEADVLYILLREEAREADTEEIRGGVTAAFDQHGRLISLEYIGAAADGLVVDDTIRVSVVNYPGRAKTRA